MPKEALVFLWRHITQKAHGMKVVVHITLPTRYFVRTFDVLMIRNN